MDDMFPGWSGLPRVDEQLEGLLTPLGGGARGQLPPLRLGGRRVRRDRARGAGAAAGARGRGQRRLPVRSPADGAGLGRGAVRPAHAARHRARRRRLRAALGAVGRATSRCCSRASAPGSAQMSTWTAPGRTESMGAWRRPSASRPCRHVWVTACSWSACAPEQTRGGCWSTVVRPTPGRCSRPGWRSCRRTSRQIDVAVVTHVDSDHIGGFLPFVRSDFAHEQVRDFWFNGRQHLDGVRSIEQGEDLGAVLTGDGRWRRTPLEPGVRREADRHHGGRARRGRGAARRAAHHGALAGRRAARHAREDVGQPC